MPKMAVFSKTRELDLIEDLYRGFSARAQFGAQATCPVELTAAFVKLAASQSCGKCTPCRVGLLRLGELIEGVLDKTASEGVLELIEDLAQTIYLSSDCALGYEAGAFALRAVKGFRDDFEYHLAHGDCGAGHFAAVPCVEGCPAHVDVPAYMALVAQGRYEDAIRVIRKDNPFALSCGLICEHPCEVYCRRGLVDDPLNIRGIKRFAYENSGSDVLPAKAEATGKKIAIAGGGPAGLAAAYYLALMGHRPTVFERRSRLGGMLRYGIPAYRLPRTELDGELDFILSAGIEVELNTSVGSGETTSVGIGEVASANTGDSVGANAGEVVSLAELRQNFDAVYLAIGAHSESRIGIQNETAPGVLSAVELLRAVGDGENPDFGGKHAIVVGGGNVAMDCARSVLRLGAKSVQVVYRRRKSDMTALPAEIEAAIAEGCELVELCAPQAITLSDGQASGVVVERQMISEIRNGRAFPICAGEEAFTLPADLVVMAVGQKVDSAGLEAEGVPTERGRIIADDGAVVPGFAGEDAAALQSAKGNLPASELASGLAPVFAGGDCVTGPASAIRAVAAGKAAAKNIDAYLGFDHSIELDVSIPEATFTTRIYCARSNMVERHMTSLAGDFGLVEESLSEKEAKQEVSRCLRCDHFGLGAFRGGRSPQW